MNEVEYPLGVMMGFVLQNGWIPLVSASQNGHLEIVKSLIEAGANVNHTAKDGWTPLVIASHDGHLEIVKSLIEAGANVNHTIKNNVTAVYVASENGHHGVVLSLLGAGADVNIAESVVELRRGVRSREHQLGTREGCSGVVPTTTWAPALVGIVAFSSLGALSVVKTATDLLASAGAKL
eukprot:Em0910g1a